MASLVVVLPALPVTPITVPPQCRRAHAPKVLQSAQRIRHHEFARRPRSTLHHQRRCAFLDRRRDIIVAVVVGAA